jgi:hypothetical protein
MRLSRCFLALPALVLAAACATSASDAPGVVDTMSVPDSAAFCSGYCKKLVGCDNTKDQQTCENSCKNTNAAVFPKLRSDVLGKVSSCINAKDCKTVLGSDVVGACSAEAVASVAPSETGKRFCDDLGGTDTKCGKTLDKAKCLDRAKLYNDKALTDADLCTKKACSDVDACVDASLGSISTSTSTTTTDDGGTDTGTKDSGTMCSSVGPGKTFDFTGTSIACDDCAATSCCSEATSCANSPTCSALWQCLLGCQSDTTCRNYCAQQYSSAVSTFNAFANCFSGSCSSSCQ